MRRFDILHGAVMLMGTSVVVLLIILPEWAPGIGPLFSVVDRIVYGDKIGHAVLFCGLLLLNYGTLARWFAPIRALVLAAGSVFLLSIGTEAFQIFESSRSVSSMDLTANWLGILAAMTLIVIYHAVHPRHAPRRQRPKISSRQAI